MADGFITKLPLGAQHKLERLRRQARELHAVLALVTQDLHDQRHLAQEAERFKAELRSGGSRAMGKTYAESHPLVVAEQKKIDAARAEISRLSELAETRSARWSAAANFIRHAEEFLATAGPFEQVALSPVQTKGRESILDALETRRRRIRELRADLAQVRAAPVPSSVAKSLMLKEIDALAAKGAPDVTRLVDMRGAAGIVWPKAFVSYGEDRHPLDVLAVLAWLFRDQMVKRLDAEISECADDKSALTDMQLAEREAQIERDMLANEREEEGLIEALEAEGAVIDRRVDASPVAVLGIEFATAKALAKAS